VRHRIHWRGVARVAVSGVVLAGVNGLSGSDEVLAALPAAEGIAASVAYGVLILLGSLPGVVVPLLRGRNAG